MDSFMLRGVLCVSALCVWSSAARGRSDVLELKDADFDYIAPEHETLLGKFYAPWWTALLIQRPANAMGSLDTQRSKYFGTDRNLLHMMGHAQLVCLMMCGINAIADLLVMPLWVYHFQTEGIVNHMKKLAGPDSVPLHSEHDLENFINNFDASIVGFFSGTDSSQVSEFLKGASLMRESFRFAHTTVLELGKKYDVKYESVLLFHPPRLSSKFEERVVHHRGPLSITGLRRFIRDNIFGLCPHLTKENKDSLRKRDLLTTYYDLDYLRNPKGSNYWRNRVLKVASKFSSQGLLYSVANRNDFLEELEDEFGLGSSDATELPFVTIRTRTGNKYTMREEFTRDGKSLENFLEDYFAGRLKRYIKSEPVPAKNNGAVKVVVADTFEEIANDPEKDVLIEFYAPWCGHCKKLEPKYTELGERLYSDPNLVIAKMDATANDIPQGYDVQGFPTIYFAAAGRKDEPKRYEGAREVKDFINFLKREASKPLVLNGVKEEL
uniref:protein disulfide-isomerase n=1 Tax=Sinocyclocheilus grahami TaxID=75366 RepID=A0A672NBF7_SINGR